VTAPVAVEALTFRYSDGTLALDDLTLALNEGERTAIVGQNGSGKSTLVRHWNGLLRPTSGRVIVRGQDAASRHVADLARDVGLVFQNPDRQIFAGSAHAEVAFGPRNLGVRGAALEASVASALGTVGLAADAETNPYDLGYGRRKLLALASVLAMETPILVLDEPTTGQDGRGVALVGRTVDRIAASGRTVVAISHDMRFVAEHFDRVVVMCAGRVVLDGEPADVFSEPSWPTLASTYLEPPLPARVGAALGLGGTPTEEFLVEALRRSTPS
jgi:energy-coupling factor transport system ATP-binding protein